MDTVGYGAIRNLTSVHFEEVNSDDLLNIFAESFGWKPSFKILDFSTKDIANAHLMIEHGLENAAVISFLRDIRMDDLNETSIKRLLSISYNNLVDWHILVESSRLHVLYNRSSTSLRETKTFSDSSTADLRYEAFEKLIGRKPNPNISTLDNSIIDKISKWRIALCTEAGEIFENQALSSLFNSIFFIRAAEDSDSRLKNVPNGTILLEAASEISASLGKKTVLDIFDLALAKVGITEPPKYVLDRDQILHFSQISVRTFRQLFADFYGNRAYNYDFSLMTKHALGKLYEKYVSVLSIVTHEQPSLFPLPPREQTNHSFGAVYTPQYIASFFTRSVLETFPAGSLGKLKMIDPACGSGVFLRNYLERIIDNPQIFSRPEDIDNYFNMIYGVDIDFNASQASKLSLGLLYLAVQGRLPQNLNVENEESLGYFLRNRDQFGSFDVVMSNPPFLSVEEATPQTKENAYAMVGEGGGGRIDVYLAFLSLAVKLLKPGGLGLFVLPATFLTNESAAPIRKLLRENCEINYIVNLSKVNVFEDVKTYVILMSFRKKFEGRSLVKYTKIMNVDGMPGHALESVFSDLENSNSYYRSFYVEQTIFEQQTWLLNNSEESQILSRFAGLPKLNSILEVKQGIVTGADDVFIFDQSSIPDGEEAAFVPLMPDKQIGLYLLPNTTDRYIFYPLDDKSRTLNERQIAETYPKTWNIIESHREFLSGRKTAQKVPWYRPAWPRKRNELLIPKIVAPHLLISPRFSLDTTGEYAVTRSTYFYPKANGAKYLDYNQTLYIMIAIMNSSVFIWLLSKYSSKMARGYIAIEKNSVSRIPIPNLENARKELVDQIIGKVSKIFEESKLDEQNYIDIDDLVIELYGLSAREADIVRS